MNEHLRPEPILHDPISPAFRACLRNSRFSQNEQAQTLSALDLFYSLHQNWENNFSRPPGQNFNPQASRICQVYLEISASPNLSGIHALLGLCTASPKLAKQLGSALAREEPELAVHTWQALPQAPQANLLEPLAVFALDTLRHFHLDGRQAEEKKLDWQAAQALAKNLEPGKLYTLLEAALRRTDNMSSSSSSVSVRSSVPATHSPLLSWLFSPLHIFFFACILLFFHPLLWLAHLLGGKTALHRIHNLHNLAHLLNMKLCGTHFLISGDIPTPPQSGGMIVISNHQSMYDIPLIAWTLRCLAPRFIAKTELQRGVPSISFSLRHGEHAIIDRSSPESAVATLRQYGERAQENNFCVVIFPEGTRARNGERKAFKSRGFCTLKEQMPDAPVLLLALDGSSALLEKKFLPFPFGIPVKLRIIQNFYDNNASPEEILRLAEETIASQLETWRQKGHA